jgi:hypothetical protein
MANKDRPAQAFEGQRQLRPVAYRIMGSAVKSDDVVQRVWDSAQSIRHRSHDT